MTTKPILDEVGHPTGVGDRFTDAGKPSRADSDLDPRIGNTSWPLLEVPKGLENGATVVAEPGLETPEAYYIRTMPEEDAHRGAVLVTHRIVTEFDPAVLKEAETAQVRRKGRRDLCNIPTVTIDAASSKDLDDALAVLPPQEDGAIRVLVSIADVDSAVPVGSELDQEARFRGTSVYLPDLVVPMLPPKLSEDTLSLLPGVERATLTAELRVNRDGEVTATDMSLSLIRSSARLTYDGVAAFLDRGDVSEVPEKVRDTLRWLRTVGARLSAARAARGGVAIERDEVSLAFDAEGEPTSIDVRELTSAHALVERLMVATNEAVAQWLIDRGLPALYRVQDEPDEEQVQKLAEFATNFGFQTAFGGRLSTRGLAAFEEQFRTTTVAPSIRTVMRWLLGRARYQATPAPHYALAAPAYLHFTSPIRRYVDLVVHRIVKAHLRGERHGGLDVEELEVIAEEVNDASRRAAKAEAERLRALIARLFATRVGEEYQAHVVAAKNFGLVVQLDGLGVTGTVALEVLGPGPWRLDEASYSLVSKRRTHMVGEPIHVRVAAADEALGRLELELCEAGEG